MRTVCLPRQPTDYRLVRLKLYSGAAADGDDLLFVQVPAELAGQVIFDIAENWNGLRIMQKKRCKTFADLENLCNFAIGSGRNPD